MNPVPRARALLAGIIAVPLILLAPAAWAAAIPSPVSSVEAIATAPSQITVTWTPSGDADHFTVWTQSCADNGDTPNPLDLAATVSAPIATIDNLPAGQRYTFFVTAYTADGIPDADYRDDIGALTDPHSDWCVTVLDELPKLGNFHPAILGAPGAVPGYAPAGGVVTTNAVYDPDYDVTYAYQWLRNGKAILGATGPSYAVTKADSRKKLSVRVTKSSVGWQSNTSTSAPITLTVGGPLVVAPKVTIAGALKVGGLVRLKSLGAWPKGSDLRVGWSATGRSLSILALGRSSLKVPAAARGKHLSVSVTAYRRGNTPTLVQYTTKALVK